MGKEQEKRLVSFFESCSIDEGVLYETSTVKVYKSNMSKLFANLDVREIIEETDDYIVFNGRTFHGAKNVDFYKSSEYDYVAAPR